MLKITERPTEKTETNEIRAEFLRWLILFSKIEVDPKGIQAFGAWISGDLNLKNSQCEKVLSFLNCTFEKTLYLRRAVTRSIYLDGSLCQNGIEADGLICHGFLHLRKGFNLNGEAFFVGAIIEGNFDCEESTFKAFDNEQKTLICDGINVYGDVLLKNSNIEGEARFLVATIGHNFICVGVTFSVLNEGDNALSIDGIKVCGNMFLRENCKILSGYIDFTNAIVGSLGDDKQFWEQETLQQAYLDGFKYGHIHGDTSASFRLENMLAKMTEFKPQPYKQLAKVLRDMGHDRDADEVMIVLRDKQLEKSNESSVYKFLRKFYKWTSGYGYRPMRTLKIMFWVWLGCGFFYWGAANVAIFAPTNPLIFQKKDYNCTIDTTGTSWGALLKDYNASNNWYEASPAEYTTFQPFWYSLDIILPVVDLKMENDWGIVIPSPEGNWTDMIPFTTTNHFIRFLTWVESLAGWGLSLMLVAILSGLAKNEKE